MKADLVEYLCALSGSKSDDIEEIVGKKYKKFISFFELVREWSDNIVKLHYNLSDANTLNVTITMRCNVKEDIHDSMKEELVNLGYGVNTEIEKKKMTIILLYDEGRN